MRGTDQDPTPTTTGWPVRLKPPTAFGMGTELTVLTERSVNDAEGATVSHDATVTIVGADGTVHDGTPVGLPLDQFGARWAVGPDGVAFGVGGTAEGAAIGAITALDRSGARRGWPVKVEGVGSAPVFGSDGQIVVTLGSAKEHTSRVSVFDMGGQATSSGLLPIATAERSEDTGGCTVSVPQAPIVAQTGAIFVYSELNGSIYALDPGLSVLNGWPFEPATSLAIARPGIESEHEAGYCPSPVVPVAGPDGTLALSLEPRNSKVGGSLVAVGMDGRVRSGWPVELKRPGSEFWSVAVGSDGTTFALAVEPEAGGKSSESILAIAPDSTVRYSTTIIDP
jgi:hypothetical protein